MKDQEKIKKGIDIIMEVASYDEITNSEQFESISIIR